MQTKHRGIVRWEKYLPAKRQANLVEVFSMFYHHSVIRRWTIFSTPHVAQAKYPCLRTLDAIMLVNNGGSLLTCHLSIDARRANNSATRARTPIYKSGVRPTTKMRNLFNYGRINMGDWQLKIRNGCLSFSYLNLYCGYYILIL